MLHPNNGFVVSAVLFFILCSEVNSRLTVIDIPKPKEETQDLNWWKNGVFYQIYPRSFQDTNDDGIGDLLGITQKLEHLHQIGITAVWISQIFKSPEKEHSQGISSFTDIHPEYGTMKQFDDLIVKAKRVGIKVILDFVLNHSSKKHEWFTLSEAKEEGFEDFYIWKNGKPGTNDQTPPTNWLSVYSNSAWEWNSKRGQFYLHQFSVDQPDLNYTNPKVKEAMMEAMEFWLNKGIDGFRLDSVPFLVENTFEDEPKSNDTTAQPHEHKSLRHEYTMDQNETYQFIYELRAFIDQYNKNHPSESEKILMSEAYTSIENTMKYYGDKEQQGVHIPFNFQLIPLHRSSFAKKIVNSINEWLESMPMEQTANWLIGNHDHHRAATRFQDYYINNMNILIALLPGVMVTYNGEEIGQEDGEVTYEQCKDPIGCQAGPNNFSEVSRDFQRTPYHWNTDKNGGFTNGTPWLPVSKDYMWRNLKYQNGYPGSYFEIFKEILKLRQEEPFKSGEAKVEALTDYVIKITRGSKSEVCGDTVALISFEFDPVKVKSSDIQGQLYEVLYSSDSSIQKETKIWAREVTIPPHSTIVFKVISKPANYNWWKHALIYQVYPRSFQDSNNDGDGDLNGILNKLPYLKDLGVDVVWLSPIYKSPQIDQGYDISDFKAIDEIYGTMEDFDKLLDFAEELEIKIVMDFVPNHTSDQHEWFIKSKDNVTGYEDYYVWRKCIGNRNRPNNWLSIFKYTSWARMNERFNECYYHQFHYTQPDLNYRNEKVKQEMKDILKFWLDKGVAGFRMDAVPYLVEDDKFLDEPRSNNVEAKPDEWKYLRHVYTSDVKETFDIIYEWRDFIDTYTAVNGGIERIMMTEAYTDIYTTMYYYGNGDHMGGHFTFNFQLIEGVDGTSDATHFTAAIKQWIDLLPEGSTSNWVLGNHDKHRLATRFGPKNLDGLNMLGAILPGVMVTYNGEEIGLENGEVTWAEGKDPSACNGNYQDFEKVSRDFQRTPFHWDNSTNAGFNDGAEPWLPVSTKYRETNLLSQINQTASHYELYKRLIQLRKLPAFVSGTFEIASVAKYVLASLRKGGSKESYFHLFNLGNNEETFSLKTAYNETTPFLEIIETNDHDNLPVGFLLDVANMTLQAHQSVIAIPTERVIPPPSSGIVHSIPKFVIVLCLLINAINLNYNLQR